jgi:hypothetical protein
MSQTELDKIGCCGINYYNINFDKDMLRNKLINEIKKLKMIVED